MTGCEEPNGQRWCVEHRPPRLCPDCGAGPGEAHMADCLLREAGAVE